MSNQDTTTQYGWVSETTGETVWLQTVFQDDADAIETIGRRHGIVKRTTITETIQESKTRWAYFAIIDKDTVEGTGYLSKEKAEAALRGQYGHTRASVRWVGALQQYVAPGALGVVLKNKGLI